MTDQSFPMLALTGKLFMLGVETIIVVEYNEWYGSRLEI